jgi:hypothetical protein
MESLSDPDRCERAASKFNIEPKSPLEFDFTTLDNYVKPENTLEGENKDWISAKSAFYTLGEYHIFAARCVRDSPEQIEIKRVPHNLSDFQHDALRAACGDLFDLEDDERKWIESLENFVWFRYKSIEHARNIHGIAAVINNNLYFFY